MKSSSFLIVQKLATIMKVVILSIALAVAIAAPIDEEKTEKPPVQIIKQINQVNLDGTYTFGFEADDGSFKVETRDLLGNIQGKYGYVDHDGVVRVLEYAAGNGTGFAAKGNHLPVPLVPVQLPAVLSSPEQRALDELYQSVDDDQDGIPDKPKQRVVVPVPVLAPVAPAVVPVNTEKVVKVAVPAPAPVQVVQTVQNVAVPAPAQVHVLQPVQKVAVPAQPALQFVHTQQGVHSFGAVAPGLQFVTREPTQRELDEQFQSVDDDEDGIPDAPKVRATIPAIPVAAPVRIAPQQVQFAPLRPLAAAPALPVFSQPIVRHQGIPDFEQLVRDLQFQSVDANEDGIPDSPLPTLIRLA